MKDALTPDAQSFTSAMALARAVGVHRDQVRLWRLNNQAPTTLGLREWRQWLANSGRWSYAERIPAILAAGADPPAAAPGNGIQGTLADLGDIKEEDEGKWKARMAKAKALLAERDLAASDGHLVERAKFRLALRLITAKTLSAILASKPWDAINPTLEGLTPQQRHAIHTAFERWLMDLRGHLALFPDAIVAEILQPCIP